MILLSMMRLIEDEQIDLINAYERMLEAIVENLSSADDSHILLEVMIPDRLLP